MYLNIQVFSELKKGWILSQAKWKWNSVRIVWTAYRNDSQENYSVYVALTVKTHLERKVGTYEWIFFFFFQIQEQNNTEIILKY